METSEAQRLANQMLANAHEILSVCQGVDEETASSAPAGRWSPKEVISHLLGPDGIGMLPSFQAFLQMDTPLLEIETENPFFSERRSNMSFGDLLDQFESEYEGIADLVANLADEQLGRRAHIPMLRDTPSGEYPTLAEWIEAIASYHLGMHIDQMREILRTLQESAAPHRIDSEFEERIGIY